MNRYRVTPLNYPHQVRIIEAAKMQIEEGTNAVLFYADDDSLVARRYNVEVEQIIAGTNVEALASTYLPLTPEQLQKLVADDADGVCNDIQALAGSVLGRA